MLSLVLAALFAGTATAAWLTGDPALWWLVSGVTLAWFIVAIRDFWAAVRALRALMDEYKRESESDERTRR